MERSPLHGEDGEEHMAVVGRAVVGTVGAGTVAVVGRNLQGKGDVMFFLSPSNCCDLTECDLTRPKPLFVPS